jgi:hypothetical protein
VKEQIMLSGGVLTSIALTSARLTQFIAYGGDTTTLLGQDIYNITGDITSDDVLFPGLFCYGWWDNPCHVGDGYWICKNR